MPGPPHITLGPSPSATSPHNPGLAVGSTVPGGLGRAQRKEPLTQLQEERGQAGLAGRAEREPPTARLPAGRGVGAWVGFRFRRGCDCKARKLRKVRIKTQTKARSSPCLEMRPEQSWCLGLGWGPR